MILLVSTDSAFLNKSLRINPHFRVSLRMEQTVCHIVVSSLTIWYHISYLVSFPIGVLEMRKKVDIEYPDFLFEGYPHWIQNIHLLYLLCVDRRI